MSLNLTVRNGERVEINGNIVVTVKSVWGSRCQLAIDAPREVQIVRGTVLDKKVKQTIHTKSVLDSFDVDVNDVRRKLLNVLVGSGVEPAVGGVAMLTIVATVGLDCHDLLTHPMASKSVSNFVRDTLQALEDLVKQLKTNENN